VGLITITVFKMCHASGGGDRTRRQDARWCMWQSIRRAMTGCESGEVRERTVLTSISRACSRSALALISRYEPSSVDAHASSGAFALINSHFSASSTRAKITVSSPSASLPTHDPQPLLCDRVIDLAVYCYWYTGEQGQRERAPAENAEIAFGVAGLFEERERVLQRPR
jgi:hypothetical protein